MNFILIDNIFYYPTVVKDIDNTCIGDKNFIKSLIRKKSNYYDTLTINHGNVLSLYTNKYLILDLDEIKSPSELNVRLETLDFVFMEHSKIEEVLKVILREYYIDNLS